MTETTHDYRKHPHLAAYINRIGAEQLNYKRFMIKVRTGNYYLEKVLITINKENEVECKNTDYAPTKEEKAAIKTELTNIEWPKAHGAPSTNKLKINKDNLFEFWDRDRSKIIMCQQRIETDTGKAYIPWTFFNDGKWRLMEPDGLLPFWKPKPARHKVKIMIHEGASAAAFVDGLINDPKRKAERKAHPWAEKLSEYEHWGMIGGALAPHRTDYTELYAEKPLEVIYVCDNDFPGKSALQLVSKYYGMSMKGVMFDNSFEDRWDMKKPMPDGCRPLEDYLRAATYATETIHTGEKVRPATILKSYFIKEWVHSVKPDIYIHVDKPSDMWTSDEFNDLVQPFSGSRTTATLVKGCEGIKSVDIIYVPSLPSGPIGQSFNTHCPSKIEEQSGDAGPFIKFMDQLLPKEDDRIETMRWLATLIIHPEVKMLYALLLISETQGVGKGTLAERVLRPILGIKNVSSPSEEEVVDSDYTYWQAHKRLAIIHEIYAGHSSKAYNKLKSLITDPVIRVKQKFLSPYEISNWMHIIACSNNLNALKLSSDDRRWLIPKVTEGKQSVQYWTDFYRWLEVENGLGIIIHWAREFLKEHAPVKAGDPAPWSETKKTVVEEGYTMGIQLVTTILEAIRTSVLNGNADFERCIILDTDLVGLIHDNIPEREISYGDKQSAVRKAARGVGWYTQSEKTEFRDGTRGKLICLDIGDAGRRPKDLFKEIAPTRIRMLGKRFLVIDGETGSLNIDRSELQDPLFAEAISQAKARAASSKKEEKE